MTTPSPIRIQQRRINGWRMPPNSKSAARPSRFGNYVCTVEEAGSHAAHAAAVELFRVWALAPEQAEHRAMVRQELRGKNLACYCAADLPCHADVLLEIANGDEPA
jgi:hypothetical protein